MSVTTMLVLLLRPHEQIDCTQVENWLGFVPPACQMPSFMLQRTVAVARLLIVTLRVCVVPTNTEPKLIGAMLSVARDGSRDRRINSRARQIERGQSAGTRAVGSEMSATLPLFTPADAAVIPR